MGGQNSFTVMLPELRLMFPQMERTASDHYRIHAFGWIIKAGLDPYKEKDQHVFRDAVLRAMPEEWHNSPHAQSLIRVIRAWNPSLASIDRPVGKDAKLSSFSAPPTPPLPPMTQRERDLTREIISSAMQIYGKRKGE